MINENINELFLIIHITREGSKKGYESHMLTQPSLKYDPNGTRRASDTGVLCQHAWTLACACLK